MKILIVIPSTSRPGGCEQFVASLATILSDDHVVTIVTLFPPAGPPFFPTPGNHVCLHIRRHQNLLLKLLAYVLGGLRLALLKYRLQADVSISLIWAADLVNALYWGPCKSISLHTINLVSNPTNKLLVKYKRAASFVYHLFDKVLSITPALDREVIQLFNLTPDRVGTFNNLIPPPTASRSLSINYLQFIFCGRLVMEKNLCALLHIWKAVIGRTPNARLVVIGDGPQMASALELCSTLSLTVSHDINKDASVIFLGTLSNPDSLIASSSALLIPSLHEGLPTVALIASQYGVPVIASDCAGGCMRDFFSHAGPNLSASGPSLEGLTDSAPGALLAIPDGTSSTINLWVSAISECIDNTPTYQSWRSNAKLASLSYAPSSNIKFWNNLIYSVS